ncbi:winged helix-turn-helix domain-containing protein [Cellulomonas sp. NPDC089187]|uniref:winged helix-turn-helix domain-containing protein n=1 Tax=Cellulomonas sp. NPDC089187 TaxID=3154970 RepID=UPI00342111BF
MVQLVVDAPARRVHVQGREVHLTRSEFDILLALARRPGVPVAKDDLARLLGAEVPTRSTRRGIEVHLANLRRKIGDAQDHPPWIRTVRTRGYLLEREIAQIVG